MSNPLYRVWCKFEPDHINPLTGRRGHWRVIASYPVVWMNLPYVGLRDPAPWQPGKALTIVSTRQPRIGSIIRPHKELNRVLALRGAA